MKLRILAYAAIVGCALGASSASAQRVVLDQNSVTSVAGFVESWQQRILNENLPVADAKNWALRNMAKFSSFSAERLDLAMRANTLDELEALLVSAPVSDGTSLGLLMATKPGNISLAAVPKSDPSTSPASYADLVFTALNPCRILDSRVSQGGAGPFANGIARAIQIGPYTSYTFQGGSATSCGLNTLAGNGQIAAVMVAASSFTQTAAGYLTFYSATAPDPSATVVSMHYRPGIVQTAFVVMPTDLFSGDVWSAGISRNANTEVTIDIVGYFARPKAVALSCVDVTQDIITANGVRSIGTPACATGYSLASCGVQTGSNDNQTVNAVAPINANSNTCFTSITNLSGFTRTYTFNARCCRVPGR